MLWSGSLGQACRLEIFESSKVLEVLASTARSLKDSENTGLELRCVQLEEAYPWSDTRGPKQGKKLLVEGVQRARTCDMGALELYVISYTNHDIDW